MSSKFSTMNMREKVLVAVLGAAVIVGGYMFTRGADLNKQILVLEDQLESADKKLKKAQKKNKTGDLPKLNGKTIKSKDVKKLEKEIAAEKAKLNGYGHVFIDLRDPSGLAQLMGEITRLSERHQLQVLSKVEGRGNLLQLVGKRNEKTKSTNLNRPLYELHLQGGYSGFYQFISGLSKLGYSVVPTKININRTERRAVGGGRVLDIEMTLAM